jgi:antirestriction protein ArdC
LPKGHDDDGNEKAIPLIKGFRVFNAAQVEGWEPPVKENQGDAERVDSAETFVSNTDADIKHGSSGAFYVPKEDKLSMPEIGAFIATEHSSATESYYGCLLHELGPWTGHKSRLDRDLSGRFGSEKYAGEELVAEMTSAFLCAHLEISPAPREDHAQYLNSWMSTLREDKRAFMAAASAAQSAADYLRGLRKDLQEAA